MAPNPRVLDQYWSEPRLRMLSPGQRQALRADLVKQRDKGATGSLRANAQSLINLVDEVGRKEKITLSDRGPRGDLPAYMRGGAKRPLEQRVADMKQSLGKTPDPAARRKTWEIAVGLHGSARAAKAAGFRNPSEAK